MNLRDQIESDEGVSPVIAVILMVAITVVLAATVYVWVSGFASDQDGPEQASATASGVDLDGGDGVEWIKLTLTSGESAPYAAGDVTNSTTDPSGGSVGYLCVDASTVPCTDDEVKVFREAVDGGYSGDSWDAGENLWVPCQEEGNHLLTISVGGSTILDTSVSCDEAAT